LTITHVYQLKHSDATDSFSDLIRSLDNGNRFMSDVVEFLERLLYDGEAVMHAPPVFSPELKPRIERALESAYSDYRRTVAGPPLSFDRETAYAVAQFLSLACWLLVCDEADAKDAIPLLQAPRVSERAEAQLSADLTLRFLDSVYRRARMRAVGDPLVVAVVEVLRRWPLSGALAPIEEPPLGDLRFQDHHGLQLLYAERLSENLRSSWVPAEGRTRELVELVLQQRGKSLPKSPQEVHK
jgi:hypothetical protein